MRLDRSHSRPPDRVLRPPRASTRIFGPLVLALGLLAICAARAGDEEGPHRLSARYRRVSQLEVPVHEISGWSPIPGASGSETRAFFAVSDEGTYHASDRTVRGALYRITFRASPAVVHAGDSAGDPEAVSLVRTQDVTLRLGDLIPRLDPAWEQGGSLLDLEACVSLPGTKDLYLLAGERNPEDVTDGGANRLYVVRYPGRGTDGSESASDADLVAYCRLPDLPDDAINDRLEAVVALATPDANAWQVYAFKERTEAVDRPPVYFPLLLERGPVGSASAPWSLSSPLLGGRRPSLPAVIPDRDRLGAQADACVDSRGAVWILDRWRREFHVASTAPVPALELRWQETFDVYDLIEDVPGERGAAEPAAPGGRHTGYGRHEALTFDVDGWLWLAADLGGGRASVVTVLAPRADCQRDD